MEGSTFISFQELCDILTANNACIVSIYSGKAGIGLKVTEFGQSLPLSFNLLLVLSYQEEKLT